ncbi:hypothetical protein [Micromonospora sp. NPDC048839]|uniref:hypothetical protein n=1 Tax=Micromonospora sp. NPDC048839 TaxID=3155641 RepID=UPI0033F38774
MNRWEIILGIVLGLVVNEATDISPWAARKLAQWSAYRWTSDPEMAAGYAEEWGALIDDRPGKLLKLLTALRFALGAAGRAAPRAGVRIVRAALAYQRYFDYVRSFRRTAKRVEPADQLFLILPDTEALKAWEPDFRVVDIDRRSFVVEAKNWHSPKGRLILPAEEPER